MQIRDLINELKYFPEDSEVAFHLTHEDVGALFNHIADVQQEHAIYEKSDEDFIRLGVGRVERLNGLTRFRVQLIPEAQD